MAVTITQAEATVAIRAATDPDNIPAAISTVVTFLFKAASMCVLEFAPAAPDEVHDVALIRLLGWMYDADPTDPQISRAIHVSGAAAILAAYRSHRAGAIDADTGGGAGPTPAPTPVPGGGVPAPPPSGHYILTSDNGALTWVEFPAP